MRPVSISAPRSSTEQLRAITRKYDAVNIAVMDAEGVDGSPRVLVTATVANVSVGSLVESAQAVEDAHVTIFPTGVLPLAPPLDQVSQHVTDVTPRSALEILLSGRQSVGSWHGFLSFAVAAGVVVWLGFVTDNIYLLVAAMLISPYAGPATNTAIATARGDWRLMRQSVLRYAAALLVSAGVAALLSLLFGQTVATELMAEVSNVSALAVVLPLAAGAAGALTLAQADRSSLISGAAIGMIVAAALAPPAGLLGMSLVTGDFGMTGNAAFLLALQLAGINFAGTIVFWLFRVRPDTPDMERGSRATLIGGIVVTVIALAALIAVQFVTPRPGLERATIAQEARKYMRESIEQDPAVELVAARVEFTRPNIPGQNTLLAEIYVQRREGAETDSVLKQRLARQLRSVVTSRDLGVVPVIAVTVLGPES